MQRSLAKVVRRHVFVQERKENEVVKVFPVKWVIQVPQVKMVQKAILAPLE